MFSRCLMLHFLRSFWFNKFGEVRGLHPPGRPRSSFNDVALHDSQFVKTVELVDLSGMLRQAALERQEVTHMMLLADSSMSAILNSASISDTYSEHVTAEAQGQPRIFRS